MKVTLALDNIRSAYNVGSLLRSALAFGADSVVTIGVTPHSKQPDDPRLPHVIERAEREIAKTALGGESLLGRHFPTIDEFLAWSQQSSDFMIAVEHDERSADLQATERQSSCLVVVGSETDGVDKKILDEANLIWQIPTPGAKDSLNVATAGSISLYEISRRFAKIEP